MNDTPEPQTYAYWRSKHEGAHHANESLRRDNERLSLKVAELSAILTELRRDLYWHVERLEKTIHP